MDVIWITAGLVFFLASAALIVFLERLRNED